MTNIEAIVADPVAIGVLGLMLSVSGALVWLLSRVYLAYAPLRTPLVVLAVAVGGTFAYPVLRTSSGYAAGLVWEQVVLVIGLFAAVSLILVVVPRTRRNGRVGFVGTLAMAAGFVAVLLLGQWLELQAWDDRMVPWR